MKNAVLSRHGRLLALCGLSALVHLLVLQLVARHEAHEPAPLAGAEGPLVLRLMPARAPADAAPVAQADAVPSAPPPRAPKTRPAENAPMPVPVPPAAAASAAPAASPAESAASATAASPSASAATADAAAPGGSTPDRMAVHYRVRMPPTVRLVYKLTRRDAAGHAGPAQPAQLDWRNNDGQYTLQMDGVFGQVSSSGADSDSGIQPQRFAAQHGQSRQDVMFDPEHQRIVFGDGSEAPAPPGMQDRASLLMQLAGIGLARPGQLQNVIEIAVADAGSASIERFQVMGEEQVETRAGPARALHLAQLAAAGEPRLDVWLAPGQGWLPIQLRLTGSDGASATQVLARVDPAAP
jgi:hypothetical protein